MSTYRRYYRCIRFLSICKYVFIISLFFCSISYVSLKLRLSIDYQRAAIFHKEQRFQSCRLRSTTNTNETRLILFWTKIFSDEVDVNALNYYLWNRCGINRCEVTKDRRRLCQSDAVVFHARGGIRSNDLPRRRSPDQRYVLLTKEPPYKTTAIIGYLNYFFNWTATYRRDSDIDYSYFRWRRKQEESNVVKAHYSFLQDRSARAAVMISNCYSQNNRERYLKRLQSVLPVTRVGFCSWNKCAQSRHSCLDQLAKTHPFYLAFENSLCKDYVTEKYANVILNSRMIPIVFTKNTDLCIPNSFIDANQFSSPEELGRYLRSVVMNSTAYNSYFQWKNHYELVIPDENAYLCQLCQKLHDSSEPSKIYSSMKQWLYEDAHCQRWNSRLNKNINIPVEETMDYQDTWF